MHASVVPVRRGQVNPRSWDAAIRAVQKDMLELAAAVPLTDEQDRILTTAFLRCGELSARKHLAWVPTNRELAAKYAISPRTVKNWRREGCPFGANQTRVLGWIARRRYAPAGTRKKFCERLRHRQTWAFLKDGLAAIRADTLALRALHKAHGVAIPEWVRGGHFRQR